MVRRYAAAQEAVRLRVHGWITSRWPSVPVIHNGVVLASSGEPVLHCSRCDWLSATGAGVVRETGRESRSRACAPPSRWGLRAEPSPSLAAPLLTSEPLLGLAYMGNSSGMTTAMGTALASARRAVACLLAGPPGGWALFMTGSDTSANAVFGKLQTVSAGARRRQSFSSRGGTTWCGTMISPGRFAVACATTGQVGNEAGLFRLACATRCCSPSWRFSRWLQATLLQRG